MNDQQQLILAFFSQQAHDEGSGAQTLRYRDEASGNIVFANYLGQIIAGQPGHVVRGKVVRPVHVESYTFVGEVGPGKLRCIDSLSAYVTQDGLSALVPGPRPRRILKDEDPA